MAVVQFTTQNFDEEDLKSDVPVLVDFWATWCGPCKMQGPIVEELAQEVSGVKIGKLETDDNSEIAERYGIMSIPTLMVFKNGEIAAKAVGVQQKEQLKEMLGV